MVNGGIARGKISELIGPTSSGRTSLAAAFAASATVRDEVVGWIDGANAFDPASMRAAGVDLARVLWVAVHNQKWSQSQAQHAFSPGARRSSILLKAAELVLDAGGFGLVVIDFGGLRYPLLQSAALRLARAAERSGAAVLALASHRICGTFAALSLALNRIDTLFELPAVGAPAVFDGLDLEVRLTRNKFGGLGGSAIIRAITDPVAQLELPVDSMPTDSCIAAQPALVRESGN